MGYVDVVEAKPYTTFWETIWGKITIGAIILALLWWVIWLPIAIVRKWFKYGRDPKVATGVASAWFDPPVNKSGRKLTPAETGGLIDETVGHQEIAASIVHMAQRGFLKISETKKDTFKLLKTGETKTDELLSFEKELFDGLFPGKNSRTLTDVSLISTVQKTNRLIYQQLVVEDFFPEDPAKVRTRYIVLGVLAVGTLNLPLALVAFTFGRNMAAKTVTGAEAANIGKSLKNFLVSQDRTLEHQAKTQEMFEKLLPYAIAFGVEKIWAKRFDGLTMQPNGWYDSYDQNRMFQTHLLASSLGHAVSQVRAAATPTSSSTGHSSGFSGGHSGGGGSW